MISRILAGLAAAVLLGTAPAIGGAAAPVVAPTLSIDLVLMPLPQALSTLARTAGVDLVVEGQMTGTVTLHISRQSFTDALTMLAKVYHLDVRAVGARAYVVRQLEAGQMVVTPAQAQTQDPVIHAYHLRYALASELADEIRLVLGVSAPAAAAAPLVIGQPAQPGGGAGSGYGTAPQPAGSGGGAGPSAPAGSQGAGGTMPGPSGAGTAAPPSASRTVPAAPPATLGSANSQNAAVAVASDDRSNTVIVTAPWAMQVQVQDIIAKLDRAQPGPAVVGPSPLDSPAGDPVLPQTYRYPIRYADPTAMTQVLQAEVPGVAIVADLRTNALLVTGNAARQRRVAAVLRALDTPATQILIQTEILDLSKSATSQLGVQWNWQPYTIGQLQIGSVVFNPTQSSSSSSGSSSGTSTSSTPTLNTGPIPIVAAINAMVSRGEGRVLANPQVATQDGVQASINVGRTIYVPVTSITGGTTTTSGLQTINAGILLLVTPRLNRNGVVTHNIVVQSNDISGYSPQGYPEITTRAVNSIITVRDGEPILIGGLITDATLKNIQKVPLLGDIPLIGELFRYQTSTTQYDNIVIILTPRVLAPGAVAPLGSAGGS